MKLIVVEGPDGCGKSTLIERLSRESARHFVHIRRSGAPKTLDDLRGIATLLTAAASSAVSVVCERHPFISEIIYGETLRGANRLSDLYSPAMIRSTLIDTVERIIYCRPPTEYIEEGILSKPQLKGVAEKLPLLVESYDQMMDKMMPALGIPVIRYNWRSGGYLSSSLSIDRLFFGEY